MRIRAFVAALVLPLPFAALPMLSVWVGGLDDDSTRDYALTFSMGSGPEFVLTDGTAISDSFAGDPSKGVSYAPNGNVMSFEGDCSSSHLVEG